MRLSPLAGVTLVVVAGLLLAACGQVKAGTAPASGAQSTAAAEATPSPAPVGSTAPTLPPEEPPPSGAASQFSTDFSKHSVPYSEILSGGPPKDGIPAINEPSFISVEEANDADSAAGSDFGLKPQEPVILLEIGENARAYPLQILTWHEIVNDTVDGVPVTVTFCPLCNTAIAFERTLDGRVLDFGTTGRLRYSNLVMYDRQTESWWQQATGEAIVGELTGQRLTPVPASIISWADFREAHPDGKVLSRDTGYSRPYGRNPYVGYDDVNQPPFLYVGPETPGALPPMARVLTIDLNGEAVAYPYEVLQEVRVVNDVVGSDLPSTRQGTGGPGRGVSGVVGGTPVVVFWAPGTASALDADVLALGRDVGAAVAFSRELDGQTLTFRFDGDHIIDEQTGSQWDVLGRAVSGKLAGRELTPVVTINHFWFSWAAFRPETRIYQPPATEAPVTSTPVSLAPTPTVRPGLEASDPASFRRASGQVQLVEADHVAGQHPDPMARASDPRDAGGGL